MIGTWRPETHIMTCYSEKEIDFVRQIVVISDNTTIIMVNTRQLCAILTNITETRCRPKVVRLPAPHFHWSHHFLSRFPYYFHIAIISVIIEPIDIRDGIEISRRKEMVMPNRFETRDGKAISIRN